MVDITRASPAPLDQVFQALSDPTRRAMLGDLAGGPRTVGELAAPFDISLAGASKHIQVLERAGLLRREVQGRVHTCHLDARPLHAGAEWLRHYERFWNRRLDALEALLRADGAGKSARSGASAARKKPARRPAGGRATQSPRRKP